MVEEKKYKLFGDKGYKVTNEYHMRYGGGDALEQFYNRILYTLRNNRGYQVVKKVKDYYNVAPNSQQFGFATNNLRQEIQSASGLLGQVGQIVKGLVSIRKDKQRIDECLAYYDKNGRPNELVLKGLWADFVDSKTGPSSLAQAAQKLEYFAARDWFFKVNSSKEALELEGVPGNVKTFLAKKFTEYEAWRDNWKPRLEEMREIIDERLKASKQTVNLYKKWIQPLLKNVDALEMAPDRLNPDLLKIGGSTYSEVKIVAWDKKIRELGGKTSFTYEPLPPDKAMKKEMGEKGIAKYGGKEVPFVPVLEFEISLRASQKGFTETVVDFTSKLYDKKKFEELYWDQWTKDPVDEWVENLMLNEELLADVKDEEEKPEEGKLLEKLFSFDIKLPKIKFFEKTKKEMSKYELDKLISKAGGEVKTDIGLCYFVLKKGFGMLAEFEMYVG